MPPAPRRSSPWWRSPRNPPSHSLLLAPALLQQLFGNLHRVERRALQELIAAYPEAKAVVQRAILPDAADFAIVFLRREQRHRVAFVLGLIHQVDTGRLF